MKMRLFAVAAALAVATSWAQVRPADDATCETHAGVAGQCVWLTVRERDRLNIHTTGSCNMKGRHAGSCHTCVTKGELDYLGQRAKTEDPNAAKKK